MQMESSKDSLEELVLSLRHVGLGDGLRSSGLAAVILPLKHLPGFLSALRRTSAWGSAISQSGQNSEASLGSL